MTPVYSTIFGSSAEAFPQMLGLHVQRGSLVLDMTYAKGIFWKRVSSEDYRVVRSDIADWPGVDLRCDLRLLPFGENTFDSVVIDPPFGNCSTVPRTSGMVESYNLESAMGSGQFMELYSAGIIEAARILKPKGVLIVKCQNYVNNGRNHWPEEEIYNHALGLGFKAKDKFLVVPKAKPVIRHSNRPQQHARKWGSIFWVFERRYHC